LGERGGERPAGVPRHRGRSFRLLRRGPAGGVAELIAERAGVRALFGGGGQQPVEHLGQRAGLLGGHARRGRIALDGGEQGGAQRPQLRRRSGQALGGEEGGKLTGGT